MLLFRKRLFFVAIVVTIVRFSEEKAIYNGNFKFDVINGELNTRNQVVNENFNVERNQMKKLNERMVDRDQLLKCVENCSEKDSKASIENDHVCPYENKELCLLFSLSKIAKIQVASLNRDATNNGGKSRISDSALESGESSKVRGHITEVKEVWRTPIYFNYFKRPENENVQTSSVKQTKSSSVHCQAIRDVYIPKVKQNLPAFACKLNNNTFILSSVRFLEDRRTQLDINLSEDTFKNIKSSQKASRSNKFNVVPALLVLNTADNVYRIETHNNILTE